MTEARTGQSANKPPSAEPNTNQVESIDATP